MTKDEEIAQLRAELAAIRAAGGEQVEVIGHVTDIGGFRDSYGNSAGVNEEFAWEDLMTVAQHQRIVAAMAAELAEIKAGMTYRNSLVGRLEAELEAARKQEPVATLHAERLLGHAGEYRLTVDRHSWLKECRRVGGEFPLYALPPLAGKVSVPDVCDGREQEAFEAFAKRKGMDTSMHPLHWLFLNRETYAARQGWKAAIRYCRALLATPSMEVKHEG